MNLFQPTFSTDGFSMEAILFVTLINRERHKVAVMKPAESDYLNSKKYKEPIQLSLFLKTGGRHVVFFDDELRIIPEGFYLQSSIEDDGEMLGIIQNFVRGGTILLPYFITYVITRFCKNNNAQLLGSNGHNRRPEEGGRSSLGQHYHRIHKVPDE